MDIAIRNGHVYTPDGVREADIGIRDGTILEIGAVDGADRVIDVAGGLVLPGLVNAHTHSPMTLLRGHADDMPLQEWLEEGIWPVEEHLEERHIRAGAQLAALEMITTGTTTFGDMYFHMDVIADVVEETGLRATLGRGIIGADASDAEAREKMADAIAFAREYDGAADGRIRTMITPHAPYTCSDDLFRMAAEAAQEHGVRTHTHLNETTAEFDQLPYDGRPTIHLSDIGYWDAPGYVAHGVHLDEAEMTVLADNGIGVAHCPSANMKLAAGVAPIPELLSRGVPVALGTDGPASNNTLDMLREMHRAALLGKVSPRDATALPADTVIGMATRTGATLLGHETGTIREGAPADLIVLDMDAPHLTPHHDLASHAVYAATGADVSTTIVDGSVLMHERRVETLDERAVLDEAEDAAQDLVSKTE